MRTVLTLLIALLLPLMAVGAWAQTTGEETPVPDNGLVSDNPLTEVDYPYEYVNAEAEFRCTWPGGCGKLRRLSKAVDPDADPFTTVLVHNVFCDQDGKKGDGCSVTTVFNKLAADGGIAGPAEVLEYVENQLEEFKVTVVDQTPIRKVMDNDRLIEGLDIKARDTAGEGEVWIRGLLSNGDIYILAAWKAGGGLWDDPEYQDFFSSFLPGTE